MVPTAWVTTRFLTIQVPPHLFHQGGTEKITTKTLGNKQAINTMRHLAYCKICAKKKGPRLEHTLGQERFNSSRLELTLGSG